MFDLSVLTIDFLAIPTNLMYLPKALSGQDNIPLDQVKDMLDMVGLNIPNYKMRTILNDLRNSSDTNGDLLSKTGFEKVDFMENGNSKS